MNNTWPGWKTERLIGKGSFGSVYEIQKEQFGRIYKSALKVISIPSDDQEYREIKELLLDEKSTKEYFRNQVESVAKEFDLLSSLRGFTNIVSIDDQIIQEKENGVGWDILIKMELLTPLTKVLSSKKLDEKEICKLGIDICTALEICQSRKIIHRDIKPANIFVNDNGDYKLGDFGIARTISKTHGTLSHKGTYNYMAPEVYLGQKYDYTVDIYSLGMVLYRLLNNNFLPFITEIVTPNVLEEAMAKRIRGEKIPALNIDSKLSDIVLKNLEYKPEDRYQSATEFKEALEKYLNPVEVVNIQPKEEIEPIEEETVILKEPVNEEKTVILEQPTIILEEEQETTNLEKEQPTQKVVEKSKEEKKVEPKPISSPPKKNSKLPAILVTIALVICAVFGMKVFSGNAVVNGPIEESEDTIKFGTYNGESIEWIVLDEKEDGSKLLLSKYLLDWKEYNEEDKDVTWETCTLREWLNEDFYKNAFTKEEQTKIQLTKVVNKDNEEYVTKGGNDTEDYIILLSIEEAETYFKSDEEREATYVYGESDWYWLRSPGYYQYSAAYVDGDGSVNGNGDRVDFTDGVRPALWVNL